MSFLAGRLAAKEGAYFLQESKTAVGRLAEKLPPSASAPGGASAQPSPDVLPEILRHSVPIKGTPPPAEASLSASSRWALPPGGGEAAGLHPDALNPLRSYVSLPQATFGPKRWQLPNEQPNYLASTANERRRDRAPPPLDPENLKAVIAGYSQSIFSCLKVLSSSVLEYLLSSFFYCNSWEGIHYCNFYGVWRSNSCAVVHSR
ncbi:O-fucosyltransferase family protein [Zea mays]|uniref:O-fucosyltransferase family protein n=1 Tax=Zea mays TaxID=4577 RepID=A0A1D6LW19_MAIZE|nr:O-fucosyltransferase family protein [Zea mays]